MDDLATAHGHSLVKYGDQMCDVILPNNFFLPPLQLSAHNTVNYIKSYAHPSMSSTWDIWACKGDTSVPVSPYNIV